MIYTALQVKDILQIVFQDWKNAFEPLHKNRPGPLDLVAFLIWLFLMTIRILHECWIAELELIEWVELHCWVISNLPATIQPNCVMCKEAWSDRIHFSLPKYLINWTIFLVEEVSQCCLTHGNSGQRV